MSSTRSDQTTKEKHDDLSKRRTLTKLGVDSGQQQTRKSTKPLDKPLASEHQLSSTPLNSLQPRTEPAVKTGYLSPLNLDITRRRTEV